VRAAAAAAAAGPHADGRSQSGVSPWGYRGDRMPNKHRGVRTLDELCNTRCMVIVRCGHCCVVCRLLRRIYRASLTH